MNKGGHPLVPKRGTLCSCVKGGYVPLLLDKGVGFGMKPAVMPFKDMSKTKELLGGLTVTTKRKKYISI